MRKRLLAIAFGFSAGWSISAILALVILGAWIDLAVELFRGAASHRRFGRRMVVGLAVGVSLLMRALRSASLMTLAQRLDKLAGAHGEIVAGLDLTLTPIETESSITRGLAQISRCTGGVTNSAGFSQDCRPILYFVKANLQRWGHHPGARHCCYIFAAAALDPMAAIC